MRATRDAPNASAPCCSSRCSPPSRRRSAFRCRSRRCRSRFSRWSCSSAGPRSARVSAMASQVLYLALGLAGLPVFAASPVLPQGAARLLGPTGGYLMSYPLAAFVTGCSPSAASIAATLTVGPRDGVRASRSSSPAASSWLALTFCRRAACGRRRSRRASIRSSLADLVEAVPRRRRDASALALTGPALARRPRRRRGRARAAEHQQVHERRDLLARHQLEALRLRALCDHRIADRRADPAAGPGPPPPGVKSTMPSRPCGFNDRAMFCSSVTTSVADRRIVHLVERVDDERRRRVPVGSRGSVGVPSTGRHVAQVLALHPPARSPRSSAG